MCIFKVLTGCYVFYNFSQLVYNLFIMSEDLQLISVIVIRLSKLLVTFVASVVSHWVFHLLGILFNLIGIMQYFPYSTIIQYFIALEKNLFLVLSFFLNSSEFDVMV